MSLESRCARLKSLLQKSLLQATLSDLSAGCKSRQMRVRARRLHSFLPWTITVFAGLSACYPCVSTKFIGCTSSKKITVTSSSRVVKDACEVLVGRHELDGQDFITIHSGKCGTATTETAYSMYWVGVGLPPGAGAVSYTLPSSDIRIDATFTLQTSAPPLSTQSGTLAVASGRIAVHSQSKDGLDAEMDIELDSATGERISIIGQVVITDCIAHQSSACS
jgi:hypothetical protein